MTFVASTTPASKPETLHILASAAERSVSHPQHAESSEGHTGKSGPEQPARSMPGSAFGQHGQHLSPNSKADASRQAAAAKPDASAASAAAQQGLPAVKSVPAAGQSGMNVQGQPHAHSSSSSKSEAGKGAMAARTLMFFKGSPCALGCTVLLKGAPKHVLASVKKVAEVGGRLPPSAIRQCTHNLPHLRSSVTNAVIHLCTLVQGSPDVWPLYGRAHALFRVYRDCKLVMNTKCSLMHVLEKIPSLLQFAVYAAYRNRLETAFLADELASAIPTAADCASRPGSPKREAGQGAAFGTPSRSIAGSSGNCTPSRLNEHLQITQPDGGTALASRSRDQRFSAPKDEATSSVGARCTTLAALPHEPASAACCMQDGYP